MDTACEGFAVLAKVTGFEGWKSNEDSFVAEYISSLKNHSVRRLLYTTKSHLPGNVYVFRNWRRKQRKSIEKLAKKAKEKEKIKDYVLLNSENLHEDRVTRSTVTKHLQVGNWGET